MLVGEGGSAAVYRSLLRNKCSVLGVNYTTARRTEAAQYVLTHLKELGGKYICFSNVHTTVMAHDDPAYREVLNASAFTFPDGAPVAGQIYAGGFPEAERMAGPDFMEDLFRMTMETGTKHFFYGSTEKTISELEKKLKENYPFLQIAGMYSPPFRELTPEEDEEAVRMINESGADLVWIGLGAPKQERWMKAHEGRIKGLMLGVGAGFDFHAGTIDRAPRFIQSIGLEWLYRMFQDPGRLVKRYLITNTKFIWYTKVKRGK
ncbi:MAG: WecB/TagA/CpsF family glycosyltransferase [Lachnospiraceae bacterium]|nr:WecB/TagA/CpsF family glycosyltransferase [Lachnospiraceae bacterium]